MAFSGVFVFGSDSLRPVSWRARTYANTNALQFWVDAERMPEPDIEVDQGIARQVRVGLEVPKRKVAGDARHFAIVSCGRTRASGGQQPALSQAGFQTLFSDCGANSEFDSMFDSVGWGSYTLDRAIGFLILILRASLTKSITTVTLGARTIHSLH